MSLPREGSREIHEGIIVSEPMDWCRSPTAIVPYKIWAKQIQAADLANSVRQTDDRSHVKSSIVRECYGDEPGTGGGVISGTHNAECTPKTWSSSVRFEDRNAVRHDDEWWMNHKNTWGRLNYRKDTNQYPTPQPAGIDPRMQLAFDQTPGAATDAPTPGVGTPTAPPASPPAAVPPTTTPPPWIPSVPLNPAGPGAMELMGHVDRWLQEHVNEPEDWWSEGLLRKNKSEKSAPEIPHDDGLRNTGDCKLIPYKDNNCPSGSQAHHVVADRSMSPSSGRLLSRDDGLTLCLKGNAFPRTLLTGHAVAQSGYDLGARAAAAQSSDGQLSLGNAENIGAAAAAAGARADGRNCDPASFKLQLRAYHAAHNLPASTRVRP